METIGKDPFLDFTKITTVYWNAKNCQDFSTTNTPPFNDINFSSNIWINFGDTVERIPAFLCNNLTRTTSYITIPNSVKTIGQRAFYYCKNVKNVRIGDSVTKIEQFAFFGVLYSWRGHNRKIGRNHRVGSVHLLPQNNKSDELLFWASNNQRISFQQCHILKLLTICAKSICW